MKIRATEAERQDAEAVAANRGVSLSLLVRNYLAELKADDERQANKR